MALANQFRIIVAGMAQRPAAAATMHLGAFGQEGVILLDADSIGFSFLDAEFAPEGSG